MKARGADGVTGVPVRGVVSQTADVKQLEGQLQEIRLQLERDGYTSVAQMRCIFVSEILRKFYVLTV